MRMHVLSFYQGLALASLLPSSWQATTTTTTTSGIAEIDLIFPRNETFAPYPMYPIVFAIQNPTLVQKSNPTLSWHLEKLQSDTESHNDSSHMRMGTLNMSIGDPHFILSQPTFDLNTEGTFRFSWSLNYTECSGNESALENSSTTSSLKVNSKSRSLYFTLKNSDSSKPDFVALTNDNACRDFPNIAWNVTDVQPSCASLSPVIPDPSPCKFPINSSVASTISTALIAFICEYGHLPVGMNTSCPSNTSTASSPSTVASATTASATSAAGLILPHGVWIIFVIGLFLYTFA